MSVWVMHLWPLHHHQVMAAPAPPSRIEEAKQLHWETQQQGAEVHGLAHQLNVRLERNSLVEDLSRALRGS